MKSTASLLFLTITFLSSSLYHVKSIALDHTAITKALTYSKNDLLYTKVNQRLYTGQLFDHDKSTKTLTVSHYKNGYKEGIEQRLVDNTLIYSTTFHLGERHGPSYEYDLQRFIDHKKNVPVCDDGSCYYEFFDPNGNIEKRIVINQDTNQTFYSVYEISTQEILELKYFKDLQLQSSVDYKNNCSYLFDTDLSIGISLEFSPLLQTSFIRYYKEGLPIFELKREPYNKVSISYYYPNRLSKELTFGYNEDLTDINEVLWFDPSDQSVFRYLLSSSQTLLKEEFYLTNVAYKNMLFPYDYTLVSEMLYYPNQNPWAYLWYGQSHENLVRDGRLFYWDKEGHLKGSTHYVEGNVIDGIDLYWDTQGRLDYECPYKEHKKEGLCRTYYYFPQTIRIIQERYINDKASGRLTFECPLSYVTRLGTYDENTLLIKDCSITDTSSHPYIP